MKQPLLLLLASVMLVSCSSKYGSKFEATEAKDKWIKEGGSIKTLETDAVCDGGVFIYGANDNVDCSKPTEITKMNRKCINEKETHQFVCMEMKQDGLDYTYFKY